MKVENTIELLQRIRKERYPIDLNIVFDYLKINIKKYPAIILTVTRSNEFSVKIKEDFLVNKKPKFFPEKKDWFIIEVSGDKIFCKTTCYDVPRIVER